MNDTAEHSDHNGGVGEQSCLLAVPDICKPSEGHDLIPRTPFTEICVCSREKTILKSGSNLGQVLQEDYIPLGDRSSFCLENISGTFCLFKDRPFEPSEWDRQSQAALHNQEGF